MVQLLNSRPQARAGARATAPAWHTPAVAPTPTWRSRPSHRSSARTAPAISPAATPAPPARPAPPPPPPAAATAPPPALLPADAPGASLRAVVIGSGLAGLTTARILANSFDQVLILERDAPLYDAAALNPSSLPDLDGVRSKRRGVPQFQQPHVMLTRGLKELEAMFPGLQSELEGAGAQRMAAPKEWIIYDSRMDSGRLPHQQALYTFVGCTRALMETAVRRRVEVDCTSRVSSHSGCSVSGLLFSEDGTRVTGLQLADGRRVLADLVVDCSGRGSKMADWLADGGWEKPEVKTATSGCVYTSASYRLAPEALKAAGAAAAMIVDYFPGTRTGIAVPVEGGLHQLILTGRAGDVPPRDDAGISEFMASLPDPGLTVMFQGAERVGPIHSYTRTENYRRLYEQIKLPDNLVVLGDSACALNPIYGQGMSVAIVEAVSLGKDVAAALAAAPPAPLSQPAAASLRRAALAGVTQRFMARIGGIVDVPWALALGSDAPYIPSIKPSLSERIISAYFDQLTILSANDARIYEKFALVMNLEAEPASLLAPGMVLALLAFKVKRALAALTALFGVAPRPAAVA